VGVDDFEAGGGRVKRWYNGYHGISVTRMGEREMKPSVAMRGKREAILEIAAQYGARNVRVFGSVARGEDTAKSDLDLLVDLDEDRSYWDVAELCGEIQDILRCKVQVVLSDSLHHLLKNRILNEARTL
jgi:predicted nucleotidyltransferase